MSKEAQKSVVLDDDAQEKFDQCVTALAAMRWPDGPPEETTFAEIEQFGHKVGRMLGRAVDQELTYRNAEQFQEAAACPTCQTTCQPNGPPMGGRPSKSLFFIARFATEISFPQRLALKIDGRYNNATFSDSLRFSISPHAIERIHETAKVLQGNKHAAWETYGRWITDVWQHRLANVLA